ncbi:MAG: response regulator [Caldilineaceae bacterium]
MITPVAQARLPKTNQLENTLPMRNIYSEHTTNQPLILLVEPMADLRNRIATAMKRTSLRLLAAESGKSALNIASRIEMPTLAVIELVLPDMRGIELAQKLYRQKPLPIIMTGYQADPMTIMMILDQLGEDFVQKPFDERELVARILRLLPSRFRSTQDIDQSLLPNHSSKTRSANHLRTNK